MSMEHKAFLFNTKKFHDEIEDIIFECTKANNIQIAIDYINANLDSLYSPYTEEQLDEHWESEIELGTNQEYFDFLLTACYDPSDDIGLSYAWDSLIEVVKKIYEGSDVDYWIIGGPIVSNGIIINPSAMGLGIIEAEEVSYILNKLVAAKAKLNNVELSQDVLYELDEEELDDAYEELCEMYQKAKDNEWGLMMTF